MTVVDIFQLEPTRVSTPTVKGNDQQKQTVPDGFDHAEAHLHTAVGVVLSGLR